MEIEVVVPVTRPAHSNSHTLWMQLSTAVTIAYAIAMPFIGYFNGIFTTINTFTHGAIVGQVASSVSRIRQLLPSSTAIESHVFRWSVCVLLMPFGLGMR